MSGERKRVCLEKAETEAVSYTKVWKHFSEFLEDEIHS
jgi:hypothetical protein